MVDEAAGRDLMLEYSRTPLASDRVDRILEQLTHHATQVLEVDGAGAVIDGEERRRVVIATSEAILRLEEDVVTNELSPCYEASTRKAPVEAADLALLSDQWPGYCRAASTLGFRSVLSLPLDIQDTALAALGLYRRAARTWSPEEIATAQLLAEVASARLRDLRALIGARRLAGQLQQALDSRVVIEQAKGMIAARRGIDVATAFEVLRRHARDTNRNLQEVADEVVRSSRGR